MTRTPKPTPSDPTPPNLTPHPAGARRRQAHLATGTSRSYSCSAQKVVYSVGVMPRKVGPSAAPPSSTPSPLLPAIASTAASSLAQRSAAAARSAGDVGGGGGAGSPPAGEAATSPASSCPSSCMGASPAVPPAPALGPAAISPSSSWSAAIAAEGSTSRMSGRCSEKMSSGSTRYSRASSCRGMQQGQRSMLSQRGRAAGSQQAGRRRCALSGHLGFADHRHPAPVCCCLRPARGPACCNPGTRQHAMLNARTPPPARLRPSGQRTSMDGSSAAYCSRGSVCCRNSAYCMGRYRRDRVELKQGGGRAPGREGRAASVKARLTQGRVASAGTASCPTWVHTSWHLSYSSAMSFRWVDCTE